MTERTAKIIRIVTVPPVLAAAFVLVLWSCRQEIFGTAGNMIICIISLAVFPALSYAVWAVIPGLREKGRDLQRKMAFIFTLVGYLFGWIYGHISTVPEKLLLIYDSYLLSALILAVINFAFKIKASGHACSVTGPLILSVYFLGWAALFPCLIIEAASYWASLRTKRHTWQQLIAGTAVALTAFGAGYLIMIL